MTETLPFATQLKRLRLAVGLTQEALAERAGLSAKAISDLERDPARLPQLGTGAMLAEALQLAPEGREALATARALKDQALEALACNNLGEAARLAGDAAEATAQYEQGMRPYREMGARAEVPRLLHNCGYLALHAGDVERAGAQFDESLTLFRAIGQRRGMAEAIAGLAATAAQAGTPEGALRAARLWAAADAAHTAGGTRAWPVDQAERDRYEQRARAAAGTTAFDAAYAAGQALSLDDGIPASQRRSPYP